MTLYDLKLKHYSKYPLEQPIKSCDQKDINKHSFKPEGFWVSVENFENGWREWCIGEEWNLEGLSCAHDITLHPEANILWLRSLKDIDEFAYKYKIPKCNPNLMEIVWSEVAKLYQGIIIAPYIHDSDYRWRYMFYSSWDCSSGCIWDASAIKEIALD